MVQEQLTALDGNGQQESAPQSRMGSADGKWRAPVCNRCQHKTQCPIQEWPGRALIRGSARPTKIDNYGPTTTIKTDAPTDVWLTAESLGENDPALLHNRACQQYLSLTSLYLCD